jgi:integrase
LSVPKKNVRADKEREAFEHDDLKRLVASEIFQKDNVLKEPEKYWIPLVALFSGMRLNEICQLYVADVMVVDDIPCFEVNGKADKKIKTASSERLIPIHPKLLELGFMAYVEDIRGKSERLWPNIKRYRDGYGKIYGNWYGRFNRANITENPKKCFHSFRHSFIDGLKQLEVQDKLISELVGHANESITTGRYGKRYQPKVLLEALKKLDYGIEIPNWKGQ